MNNKTKQFYDNLSSDYHLIFGDWDKALEKQSKIIDTLIKQYAKEEVKNLLDCSCGIGTQAIGLAQLGYKVYATDLSPKAIERAKIEAEKRGVALNFGVADFLKLKEQVAGVFDVIISYDNSLPHLLKDEEISLAAENIFSKLESGGLFMASIRDYDALLEDKPRSSKPSVKDVDGQRTISFQVWDWISDRIYKVNHFTLKGADEVFETSLRTTHYRAYQRHELYKVFEQAGFVAIKWLMPEESAYYQPIMLAMKP